MANITRIKNNQITDSTITVAKLANQTLTGAVFAPNLTLNSDVNIIGNLSISGNTETLNSVNTYIQDPLVMFNSGYTGSISSYNIGFIVNRNWSSLSSYGSVNTAWVWVEADQAFEAIATTTSGNALTSLTNSGFANLKVGNITSAGLTTTGTVTAGAFVGPMSGASGSFTTLYALNFSTGNAQITGGSATNLTNFTATTAQATNLSSGNVVLTGGYINNLANISATQGTFTNLSAANIAGVANGNFTTLVATNLSSSNAQITGGTVTGLTNLTATTSQATNLSSGNIQGTGGTITGLTNLTATTSQATNFSSGNAVITGGSATGLTNVTATTLEANNFSSPNVVVTGGYVNGLANISATQGTITNFFSGNINGTFNGTVTGTGATANVALYEQLTNSTVNATTYVPFHDKATGNAAAYTNTALNFNPSTGVLSATQFSGTGNFTTLVATNLSSSNLQATGGTVTGLTNLTATTAQATNFSTGNAQITGGSATGLTNLTATTAQATNLSSGNVVLTGGYINGLANISATQGTVTNFSSANISGVANGNFTTLVATNLSSGNAQITGGTITGLTNLTATTAQATNLSSGNAQITGGYADNHPIGANTAATGAFTTLTASGITTLTSSTNATGVNTGALQVTGGASVAKDLWVGGNVYANAIVSTTTAILTIQDSLVYFQAPSPTGAYNYDQGFYSDMTIGNYQHTGVIRNHNNNYWTFFSNVASEPSGNTVNWSDAGIVYDPIKAGALTLANTTAATSTSTGALIVAGGAGIAGALWAGSINTPSAVFTTLEANNFSSPNVVITGGYVNGLANITATQGTITNFSSANISGVANGNFTTLVATNFSSPNVVITGGYVNSLANLSATQGTFTNLSAANIAGVANGNFTTLVATNLSSGNIQGTGGTVTGLTNLTATTAQATNLSSGNAQITGGSATGLTNLTATTAQATNLSSGNVVLTGGYINNLANISATQGTITNFSSANISGVTNGFITTLVATNLSSGNAQITGGTITGLTNLTATTAQATNLSSGNIQGTGGAITGLTNLTATTALATNFSSGNIQGTGGTITGLTNLTATTAQATNLSSGNAVITGGSATGLTNVTATTLEANNFSSPNVVVTGGYVNGLANISATTGTFTNLSSGNIIMTGGYMDNVAIGANVAGSGRFGTLTATQVSRLHGNVVADSGVDSTSTTTGALVVVGGVGIMANVYHGGATILNANATAGFDTIVKGPTDSTLLWARPGSVYDQVLIGGSASPSTLIRGAKLQINSTDSILLPTGTTAQRPSNTGGTDTQGMFRYNTTTGSIESYSGSTWQSFTTSFTVITDEQFTGTGAQVNFTLAGSSTTSATIVSINGVMQIPTLAYSVSGTTLTFTEAPASTDIIDVRRLTTTATVSAIASTNGYMGFYADNNGAYVTTGTTTATNTTYWEPAGAQVNAVGNVSVASANTPTTIDTIDTTKYRSAKYVVQVTNGSNYQVEEVLVISNGTTATSVTYGVLSTNGNLGLVQATQSGSNTLIQFIAANATNSVRIKKDYLLI